MDELDDETPTPRVTGSYAVFRDECANVAAMLDDVAFTTRKRIDLYDEDRLRSAESLARELRALSKKFAAWPELDMETVAQERRELEPRAMKALRAGLLVLERMPTHGTLGRVRRR